MAETKGLTSRLIVMSPVEPKDELDEKLERCYALVSSITKDMSEREANDALQAFVSKCGAQHDDVQLGLFYAVLVDPKSAPRTYRDITLVNQDGMSRILNITNQLIYEKWIKLTDTCRTQLVWFTKELVRNAVSNADHVCHSLLRQIAADMHVTADMAGTQLGVLDLVLSIGTSVGDQEVDRGVQLAGHVGGDLSPKNVWLAETLLDIFTENRPWLDKCPSLLALSLFTYLRVIVDHGGPLFAILRQREVDFCVSLMREKWLDCQSIGRDLIRLLQSVARIPEFEDLWKDLILNPQTFSPQFTGIYQLLQIRTSSRFFRSRLTPDMENKLNFLTSRVRFGQQKRYQDWFQRQYLSTPESQSLRCDLIRYICAVIHPSNEVLCSDIIPRWAVIGWLLTTCTSNVAASNAKLALFYDWFFFDAEKDSIMNIEPCILVMYHSMRPHPAITATLLDFMCRITPNFYPPLASVVRQGILASLGAILEKRVLPSLAPLFDNPKLDKDLCCMLRENFSEFCSSAALQPNLMVKEELTGIANNNKEILELDAMNHANSITGRSTDISAFSDEEEFTPAKPTVEKFVKVEPVVPRKIKKYQPINLNDYLQRLEGDIKAYVTQLPEERDKESQCELVDRLMQVVMREDFVQEDASNLAACLCHILRNHFISSILPQEIDDESIEDSIGVPVFIIFRNVCQTPEEDPSRVPLMMLLEEMYKIQPRVGYHFLYFLKVSKMHHEENMSSYRDFCKSMENQSLEACLMTDLRLCQEEDVRLFAFLIPDIYTQFPSIAVGNIELIHLVVSCIDGSQLQDLVCEILQGQLVMFRDDSILAVLNASLEWETIEQYFMWQLISVHNVAIERIMPILPKLEFSAHAEALCNIMIQLKQDGPTSDLLRPLLCRDSKRNDLFTVSMLKFWAQEYSDKLAELLHVQLMKSSGTPKKRSSKVPQVQMVKTVEKDHPTVEQILAHLDHMRVVCKDISFIMHESIQQALQHVQTSCTDSFKAKYSDLLALVDEDEMRSSTRVLRQVPSRRASQAATATKTTGSSGSSAVGNRIARKTHIDELDSSSDSSDDEENIHVPKSKRMKRSQQVSFGDD